jgi:hypothetical protein
MTNRSRILTGLGVWALLFAASPVCRADIVFSNFDPGFSYQAASGNLVGNDSHGGNFAQGDTFTPTGNYDLTSIEIALGCLTCSGNTINVSLDANNGGVPGAALASFAVSDLTFPTFGTPNAPITLTWTGAVVLLTGGTQYWVTASDPAGADVLGWNLNDTGDVSSEALSRNGGASWVAPSFVTPGAYEVDGTRAVSAAVPEPGSVALLLGVLLVLALCKPRILMRKR